MSWVSPHLQWWGDRYWPFDCAGFMGWISPYLQWWGDGYSLLIALSWRGCWVSFHMLLALHLLWLEKMSAQVPLLSLKWVTKHFATELWKFFKYFGNIPYQVCGLRVFPCLLQAAFSFCWLTHQLGFCGPSRSWMRNHCHDGCRTPLLPIGRFLSFYLQAFNQCQGWLWFFVCFL